MRLEAKNSDESAAEADVSKGAESETGAPPAEPPPPPHLLISRKEDSLPASKLSSKGSIAALNEELEAKRAGVSICSENLIFSCPTFWPN